jgi:hypothetical protein
MKKALEQKKITTLERAAKPNKITELEREVVMDYLADDAGTEVKKICMANDDCYENATVDLNPDELKEAISIGEVVEVKCSDGKVVSINSAYIISYELADSAKLQYNVR